MKRSFSGPAQCAFDAANKLLYLSIHSTIPIRFAARAAGKMVKPIVRKLGTDRIVSARLYGHTLAMPAEHPLATTLTRFPQYNLPLGLAVKVISALSNDDSIIPVIDVGANIGETIAIIEQHCPKRCTYLCIEPDQDIAELCRLNHSDNRRVEVKQCFIGEDEGSAVVLCDDGRANPSTHLAIEKHCQNGKSCGELVRLDTAAGTFAEANGCLGLIKVDTEGYDFAVLRSAPNLLTRYTPDVYFEWYPKLLIGLNDAVWSGFEYLATFGYRHFVFFTSRGDYYCKVSNPDRVFLDSLSSVALSNSAIGYFDVFASARLEVCDELVKTSIAMLGSNEARH